MKNKNVLDQLNLRKVAGAFATGITVVTVESTIGEIIGMTANSFVSVSLNPPLVAFFCKSEGSLMEHLGIDCPLAISILSEEQKQISNQFAGLTKKDISVEYETSKKYHKIKNALAWYETKVVGINPVGDHHMVICQIINLKRNSRKKPILYYTGYKSIGEKL